MGNDSREEPGRLPGAADPSLKSDRRPAILIVDDTPANLLAFTCVLESEGYEIVTASSGQEALKRALRQEFAVILLDVRMPGMDGIETATFLRSGRSRFTPIVFVSAYENTPLEVARGYLVGAIDYLFSPVDSDVLRRKVSGLVEFYTRHTEDKKRAESLLQANKTLTKNIDALHKTISELNIPVPKRPDAAATP